MKNRERVLSLITPTESATQLSQLIGVLGELGYRTRIVSPDENIADLNVKDMQVLYVSSPEQLASLLPELSRWSSAPRLAILAQGVPWDRGILNSCSEVMSWPGKRSELLFRLERSFPVKGESANDLFSELSMRMNMIGEAPAFLRALSVIRRISRYRAMVLISGETGTGKELAARAIHYLGDSCDGPFVPVNCGGIPDELFDNELFGHAQGAYTDAKGKQCGYVEQACGGTLFLDEIDALSLKSQTTLLRLLQDQSYKPLGSERSKHANIRIIAATNTDLHARVEAQEFRQDLLFRLDVLSLHLPALRERPGDAVLLAEHFIRKFSREYNKPARPLHSNFLNWIQCYTWPGNVRELENTLLRAFLLSEGRLIALRDEEPDEAVDPQSQGGFNEQKARAIDLFERQYLERLLNHTQGNISRAARLAGKERRALGKLLQKHGIKRLDYKQGNH